MFFQRQIYNDFLNKKAFVKLFFYFFLFHLLINYLQNIFF